MNKKDEKLLEDNGWVVECESPFEIRHEETNSFASLWAANYVLEMLKQETKKNDWFIIKREHHAVSNADNFYGITQNEDIAKSYASVFFSYKKISVINHEQSE